MKSLVLKTWLRLSLRDIEQHEEMEPSDVRIKVERVGICWSDIRYAFERAAEYRAGDIKLQIEL